jgi:hypothetical protein
MNLTSAKSPLKIIFLFLFLCSPAISKAQTESEVVSTIDGDSTQNEAIKEYVITKAGDTIPCKIKFGLFNILKYQPLDGNRIVDLIPTTIKEYFSRRDKNPMIAKVLPKAMAAKFVKRLEHGAISLYEEVNSSPGGMTSGGHMYGGSANIYWYAEKSGKLYLIKNNNNLFVKISKKEQNAAFDQLIADDPDVFKEFKEKKDYSWDEIQLTISTYNSWYELRKKKS